MGSAPRPQDFASRFKELERRVARMERASRLNSASIGSGGLIVRDGGRIRVRLPGDIILEDDNLNEVWSASDDPLIPRTVWHEDPSTSLPTSWTTYFSSVMQMPYGYRSGHFMMMVAAGDSFSTNGNVSVQPLVNMMKDDGTWTQYGGPAVSSGNSSVSVATSFWAAPFSLANSSGEWIRRMQFGVNVVRAGAELSPTSGNWRVASQIVFRRGAAV